MATVTSTPSISSIKVSGNKGNSGTMSWSKPTVPSNAVISSCVLTGSVSVSMSKGSIGSITINGTTINTSGTFSVNIGTNANTTSVTVTAKGSGGNASGTVSFSNLVYTVTYTVPVYYTVTFVDWDGKELKTEQVLEGNSATAPSDPSRNGYRFTGWSIGFTNVTSNLTVTAQYEQLITYTVTFVDWNGTVLKTQTVEPGKNATAPSNPSRNGYKFTGWDKTYTNVQSNLTVTAQYVEIIYYTVTFKDWDGTVLKTEQVEQGKNATAPSNPTRDGYRFTSWDKAFTNVQNNLTITAQYVEDSDEPIVAGYLLQDWSSHNSEAKSFDINIDWDTQYLSIVIKEEKGVSFNDTRLFTCIIGEEEDEFTYSGGALYPGDYYVAEYYTFPQTIRYFKSETIIFDNTGVQEIFNVSERTDNIHFETYVNSGNLTELIYDVYIGNISEPELPEEPEDGIIEWTGIGTVAENIYTVNDWTYKLNMDWNSQYLEVDLTFEITLFLPIYALAMWKQNSTSEYGDCLIELDAEGTFTRAGSFINDEYSYMSFSGKRVTLKFSKENNLEFIYNNEVIGSFNDGNITTESVIYLSSLFRNGTSISESLIEARSTAIHSIKVVALESEEPDIPEEPEDDELIQGGINDNDGSFEDETQNVVKTHYIDIKDKKQIVVTVLTDDVYILKCYLYNANKELVKILDISNDKKRMFGVDLIKLINDVIMARTRMTRNVAPIADNDIAYISFTFGHEDSTDITPEDVNVEIAALEQYLIARYVFNSEIDTLPFEEFETEENFTYTYEDVVNDDGTTTRSILSDTLPTRFRFTGALGLLGVEYLNTDSLTTFEDMFSGCVNLTYINGMADWNTSNVTNMKAAFANTKIATADVTNWDTSHVTTFESMFYHCDELATITSIGSLDLTSAETLEFMFAECFNLETLDLSAWDVNNVSNLGSMFFNDYSLTSLNISTWNTENAEVLGGMFYGCEGLTSLDLSHFRTDKVNRTEAMFCNCTNLTSLNLSNWNLELATDTDSMFDECSNLTSITMRNSDYNSVNKVISILPTRTANSVGTFDIAGVDDSSQVNIPESEAKYWNLGGVVKTISKMFLNNINIKKLFLGSKIVRRIFMGENLVYEVEDETVEDEEENVRSFSDLLRNATRWQVFGDSISTTYNITESQIWHNVITSNSEFAHITKLNNSVSGSEVSDGGRTDVLSFIERYQSLDTSADLVTVFAGVNDWCHNNIPLGNYDDTTTIDSLYGALNTLLPGLKAQCPNAEIVWLSPLKTRSNMAVESTNANGTNAFGLRLIDYVRAIEEKCEQYDILFVNLYEVEGLDPDVDTANFSYDGLHPTAAGHVAIADYLLNHATISVPEIPTFGIPRRVVINSYRYGTHFNLFYAIDAEGLGAGDTVRVEWEYSNVVNVREFNSSASFFDARGTSGVRASTEDQCTFACDIIQTGNWESGISVSPINTANNNDYPYFLAMTSFVVADASLPTSWDIDSLHVYVNDVEVPIVGMGGFFIVEADIKIYYDKIEGDDNGDNDDDEDIVYTNTVTINSFHGSTGTYHYNLGYMIDATNVEVGDVVKIEWINSNVSGIFGANYDPEVDPEWMLPFNTSNSFYCETSECGTRTMEDFYDSVGMLNAHATDNYISQEGNWYQGSSTTFIGQENSRNYPYLFAMTSFYAEADDGATPASWTIEDLRVTVNDVEVPILNMGGFFTDEADIVINFDYKNNHLN